VLGCELTLPEVAQSVIFTRMEGRTPVPPGEKLKDLARHGATLVLFLSAQMIHKVVAELDGTYAPDTPAAVVYRATWADQKVVRGTLSDIVEKVRAAGIKMTAIIIVGPVLDQMGMDPKAFRHSKLYDPAFSHGFRRGRSRAAGA